MKKIHIIVTFCLLLSSSSIGAKKPLLCISTQHVPLSGEMGSNNLNTSARLSGCKEALDSYTQQLEKLSESPLGNSERTLIGLIITDAKQMQEIVTPTSPEMGERFGTLIFLAEKLRTKQ